MSADKSALATCIDLALVAQSRAAEARAALEMYDPTLRCDVLADHRGARWGFDPDAGDAADVLWAIDDVGRPEELVTSLATETDFEVHSHSDLTFVSIYDFEQLTTLYVFTTALRRDGAP